jgi:hypothetical protein
MMSGGVVGAWEARTLPDDSPWDAVEVEEIVVEPSSAQ